VQGAEVQALLPRSPPASPLHAKRERSECQYNHMAHGVEPVPSPSLCSRRALASQPITARTLRFQSWRVVGSAPAPSLIFSSNKVDSRGDGTVLELLSAANAWAEQWIGGRLTWADWL
jgi:hypothetical protein